MTILERLAQIENLARRLKEDIEQTTLQVKPFDKNFDDIWK